MWWLLTTMVLAQTDGQGRDEVQIGWLTDAGTVLVGEQVVVSVSVDQVQGQGASITEVVLTPREGDAFSLVNSSWELDDSGHLDLQLNYAPQTAGLHRTELSLVTSVECTEPQAVSVIGRAVEPCLQVWPEQVHLRPDGPPATMHLRACGTEPMALVSSSVSDAAFGVADLAGTVVGFEELRLPITVDPSAPLPTTGTLSIDLGPTVIEVSVLAEACSESDPRLWDPVDGVSSCGVAVSGIWADDDGDGFSEADGDCDDSDDRVNPDAEESFKELDDDCDGVIDENLDGDQDGQTELNDCDDSEPWSVAGLEEFWDGRDNNCDGNIDEVGPPQATCPAGQDPSGSQQTTACGCASVSGQGGVAVLVALMLGLWGRIRRRH